MTFYIDTLTFIKDSLPILKKHKSELISVLDMLNIEYQKKLHDIQYISDLLITSIDQTQELASLYTPSLTDSSLNSTFDGYLTSIEETQGQLLSYFSKFERNLQKSSLGITDAKNTVINLLHSLDHLEKFLSNFLNNSDLPASTNRISHYFSLSSWLEREKLHIARDLHDGPTQQLLAAQFSIDQCFTVLQKDFEQGLLLLPSIKKELSTTLNDIRNLLFNLAPLPLHKLELKGAIDILLQTILSPIGVDFSLFFNLGQVSIPYQFQVTLYRIIQEAINNIKKHAHATQVILKCSILQSHIHIMIMDNGTGFNVPKDLSSPSLSSHSYGLNSIYTRVTELNGTLTINSTKGQGTTFKIELPLITLQEEI